MTAELLVLAVLPWTPATLFLPLMLNGVGNGMTIPGGTAAALSVRPDLAGTAAGLVGATQLGIGAAASILVGHFVTIWPQSLAWNFLLFVLLVLGVARRFRRLTRLTIALAASRRASLADLARQTRTPIHSSAKGRLCRAEPMG